MYFGLSEEQKSLEESITKFLEANAPLETIKAVADGETEKAKAIHQGLVDLGIRWATCCKLGVIAVQLHQSKLYFSK